MPTVTLALEAMATRFELLMDGLDPVHLRAAGEEALAEIARLDRQLSAFNRASDICWINAHAADAPIVVEPRLFDLLERCQRLSAVTDGAFDVTIGPLMSVWGRMPPEGPRSVPDRAAIEAARQIVGFERVRLDPVGRTIHFARRGMAIDLGAAGKGYAVDAARRHEQRAWPRALARWSGLADWMGSTGRHAPVLPPARQRAVRVGCSREGLHGAGPTVWPRDRRPHRVSHAGGTLVKSSRVRVPSSATRCPRRCSCMAYRGCRSCASCSTATREQPHSEARV